MRLPPVNIFYKALGATRSYSRHFVVGDRTIVTRKITQGDVNAFTKLSGDHNPIHSGQKAVVHGALLNSLVSGVMGTDLPGPGTVVVQQTLNFPKKCYAEEEVKITVEIAEVRKIIRLNFTCRVEKENKTVLWGEARVLIKNCVRTF